MPSRGIKLNRTPESGSAAPATPTVNSLPLRRADFASLAEALDYAAQGDTGANFYAGSGKLATVLPYRLLREQAQALARRLLSLRARAGRAGRRGGGDQSGLPALLLRLPVRRARAGGAAGLGQSRRARGLRRRLRGLLQGCGASVAMASSQFLRFLREAAEGVDLAFVGTPAAFDELPEQDVALRPSGPTETAYLQYTSGSTSFPRGVVITQHAVLSNLAGVVNHGLDIQPDDRCVSWLPFYHDMGLVGCMLAPMATQRSIDYLDTRDFAMRPRRWLELMTSTRATISFSPPFGYELCARRIRPEDVARYDLSAWRIAGIGAEPIRAELPDRFAKLLAPAGFDPRAFVPCYGMAESSLGDQLRAAAARRRRRLDRRRLISRSTCARMPAGEATGRVNGFVRCGAPLPGHEVAIRDDQGHALPDLHVGRIKVRGRASCRAISASRSRRGRRSRRTAGSTRATSATWSTAASS